MLTFLSVLKWDESRHPRVPGGSGTTSGQFTSGGTTTRTGEKYVATLTPPSASASPGLKPAKMLNVLATATVVASKPLSPGLHANTVYKVTLDDASSTRAVVKPETGEMWTGGFTNEDISKTITNRAFSLAEREVMAYEVSEALGLGLVPVTVHRTTIEGLALSGGLSGGDTPTMMNPAEVAIVDIKNPDAPHPKGGMMQRFVPGLRVLGDMTDEERRKIAVFDYVIGSLDRHPGNVSYRSDGRVLAMDNGYSFPNPEPGQPADGFTFKSYPARKWLFGMDQTVPKVERDRLQQALTDTDWSAFADRHPSMSPGERAAFLGRIENLKGALKTSTGLQALWRVQAMTY